MIPPWVHANLLLILAACVPIVYLVGVTLGRWLKRRHGVGLGLLYQIFCIVVAFWLPLLMHGMLIGRWGPGRDRQFQHLTALVALLAVVFVLSLIRRFYWELWFERKRHTATPKFLSQLATLGLFLLGLLLVLAFVYRINNIPGLVAGSTIVAAILGFALQDLLANIIAGISLEIGKPFRPGDWLRIDGMHLEVIELNWRSTRLRNNDDAYFDIPNKNIAGGTIVNLSFPTRQHALRLLVRFDYTVPPNAVKDCMARAAEHARGVLQNPPPRVFLHEFGDSGVVYEIKFWIDNESMYNDIVDSIRTNVWYEAQRNGMRIPYPVRTLHVERRQQQKADSFDAAKLAIRRQSVLQLLDPDQTDSLLRQARLLRFGRGEKVIEQDAHGTSMFILIAGEADVFVRANGHDTRVATLRSGDCCGEMSLLTGEPRSATVVARHDCEVWEIEKAVLADVIQENQALLQRLSELLAQRRMENEGILASTAGQEHMATKHKEYSESFLRKLYAFFEL